MRKITYYSSRGQTYARISPTSYREGGKVKKRDDGIYLGRVIDREANVFYSRERGLFTYDVQTGQYGPVKEALPSDLPKDQRKRPAGCLNFGDSYFLHEYLKSSGYDQVMRSLPCENTDTLFAMVQYFLLRDKAVSHAPVWYDGSIVRFLYPKADLSLRGVSGLLSSLGRPETAEEYFRLQIDWVKEKASGHPAVFLTTSGLSDGMDHSWTGSDEADGNAARKVRVMTAVERNLGIPLLFRILSDGGTVTSAAAGILQELVRHSVHADFVVLDAGCFTEEITEKLCAAGIPFVSRLSASQTNLYVQLLEQCYPALFNKENLIRIRGHAVYIVRTDCTVGTQGTPAYAYVGCEAGKVSEKTLIAADKLSEKEHTDEYLRKKAEDSGWLVFVSSRPFSAAEILSAYDIGQKKHFFDRGDHRDNLALLRVQNEGSLCGYFILAMMVETINSLLSKAAKQVHHTRDELLMSLENQKCLVYETTVTVLEGQPPTDSFYHEFDIRCPSSFKRQKDTLTPRYDSDTSGS